MSDSDWRPTATVDALRERARVLWTVRQFFHDRGFDEVQTPILSRDTVIDRHIDPVIVPGCNLLLSGLPDDLYLQTSPEFGMKRLLAAGMQAIVQISPVFRAAERGDFHNPEFTMVEWYRVEDSFVAGVDLLADLISDVMNCEVVERQSYQNAFLQATDCDPLSCSVFELSEVARRFGLGVDSNWSSDQDDWLNLLFAEVVQPQLGAAQPCIVTDYPATQSALAKVSARDMRVAERFELFVGGIELANGYHELLDAEELQDRNARVLLQRSADGKPALTSESRLLDAMRAGLPACSGCALGLDRLLMVATKAKSIDEVIAFPIDRA